MPRKDAHRFYEREGMAKTGYHFAEILAPDPDARRTTQETSRPA
jgi:hypothetical protein